MTSQPVLPDQKIFSAAVEREQQHLSAEQIP